MAGGGERFRRIDRLRSSKDYRRLSREGNRVMTASFVVLMAPRRAGEHSGGPRLGLTVSRRVGPAVVRTRVKRRIREWFRRNRCHLPAGRDLVVIARPPAALATQAEIARELSSSVEQLGGARSRS